MKNSYIIAGVVVLIIILGFVFASRKTEAPIEIGEQDNITENILFTDGLYELNTNDSFLSWSGRYLAGIEEEGNVNIESGTFLVAQNKFKEGNFIIDMNSIESIPHKDRLVEHLKNADFFDVSNFPTATFVLKNIISSNEETTQAEKYIVNGDLTVKGMTKPISFFASLTEDENNIYATASFPINRSDWEIKYNSSTFFNNLGDKVISDIVTIGLDLKAQKVIQ